MSNEQRIDAEDNLYSGYIELEKAVQLVWDGIADYDFEDEEWLENMGKDIEKSLRMWSHDQ